MNTVASETRLFRELALTPYTWFQVGFCLLATSMAMAADGWTRWGYPLFLLVYLVSIRVDWENYRAVGMTREHWRRHRRILMSVLLGLILVESLLIVGFSDLPVNSVLLVAVFAAWLWVLVRRPEPARSLSEIVEGGVPAENGTVRSRFPLTPVQQIIRGPQVTSWILIWGMIAVLVLVLGVLEWIFGAAPQWVPVIFAVVVMQAVWLIVGEVGKSLREWVAFGGSRRVWARETAVLGLLSPLLAGLIGAVAGGIFVPEALRELLPVTLGFAFFAPVIFTLVELSDRRRTWWVTLPYLAAGAGILVLWIMESISAGGFLAGFMVIYLIHALALPAVARNYTVFSGGVSTWMGLRSELTGVKG